MIAFTAAIQWVVFDKIDGRAYTNLFTTGNLKGVATNLYDSLVTKEKAAFDRFFHFLTVVLAFISGAGVLVFCHHLFGHFAILLVAVLFLIIAIVQSIQVWKFYQRHIVLSKNKDKRVHFNGQLKITILQNTTNRLIYRILGQYLSLFVVFMFIFIHSIIALDFRTTSCQCKLSAVSLSSTAHLMTRIITLFS